MVEEGPLPPEMGHEKKKRKTRDDGSLAKMKVLRMLRDDVNKLHKPTLKVLQNGFTIEELRKEEVRASDFTFQKVVTLLQMAKNGKTLRDWRAA